MDDVPVIPRMTSLDHGRSLWEFAQLFTAHGLTLTAAVESAFISSGYIFSPDTTYTRHFLDCIAREVSDVDFVHFLAYFSIMETSDVWMASWLDIVDSLPQSLFAQRFREVKDDAMFTIAACEMMSTSSEAFIPISYSANVRHGARRRNIRLIAKRRSMLSSSGTAVQEVVSYPSIGVESEVCALWAAEQSHSGPLEPSDVPFRAAQEARDPEIPTYVGTGAGEAVPATPPSTESNNPRDSREGSSHGNLTESDDHPRRVKVVLPRNMENGLRIVNPKTRALGSQTANKEKKRGGVKFDTPFTGHERERLSTLGEELARAETPKSADTECIEWGHDDESLGGSSAAEGSAPCKYIVYARHRTSVLRFQVMYNRFYELDQISNTWFDNTGAELILPQTCEGSVKAGYSMDSDGLYSYSDRRTTPAFSGWEFTEAILYKDDGGEKVFGSRWLYSSAIHLLRVQFAASAPSEAMFKAITSTVVKKFTWMPLQLAIDTAKYYCLLLVQMQANLLPTQVHVGSKLAPDSYYEELTDTLLAPGEFSLVPMGVRRHRYSECHVYPPAHPWARRDLFRIYRGQGAEITEEGVLEYSGAKRGFDGEVIYPQQRDVPPRRFLVACEIRSSKTKLKWARASPNNQACAISRLFKCRGGTQETDEIYSRRQLSVISWVVPLDDPDLARLGNAKLSLLPVTSERKIYETEISFEKVVGTEVWRKSYPLRRMGGTYSSQVIGRNLEVLFAEYTKFGCWWWLVLLWQKIRGPLLWATGRFVHAIIFLPLWIAGKLLGRWWYSRLQHQKAVLRRWVMDQFPGALTPEYPAYCREMTAEVKDEPLKEGKAPRLFFSLGFAAPLFAGHVPELGKAAMKGERRVLFEDFVLYTVYTDENTPEHIATVFSRMHQVVNSAERAVYFVYFSDDSVLAHNLTDEPVYWNVDISGCDASNGYGVFALLFAFLVRLGLPRSCVLGLFEQCTKRFRIRNPMCDDEWLLCSFLTFFQVSGTVLTTVINNWANLIVVSAMCAAFQNKEFSPAAIQKWAAAAGYELTIECCKYFEDVTFLKRAPMVTVEGGFAAPLVSGTILRTFGVIQCELDERVVPGSARWDLTRRSRAFLGAVIQGYKNEPHTPVLDALRRAFPPSDSAVIEAKFLRPDSPGDIRHVDILSYCRRYRLSPELVGGMQERLASLKVWDALQHEAVDAILHVDYGM
jgi:hypothetical protein